MKSERTGLRSRSTRRTLGLQVRHRQPLYHVNSKCMDFLLLSIVLYEITSCNESYANPSVSLLIIVVCFWVRVCAREIAMCFELWSRLQRDKGGGQRHLLMSTESERPIVFIPFHMLVQFVVPISQNAALTNFYSP